MLREFMDVDAARERLRDLRHRRNDAFGAAGMLVACALIAIVARFTSVAIALASGALAGAAIGIVSRQQRIHLLTRLVAQGDARSLPSVDRHARNLVSLSSGESGPSCSITIVSATACGSTGRSGSRSATAICRSCGRTSSTRDCSATPDFPVALSTPFASLARCGNDTRLRA